jgi:hypothetical protein
MDVIGDKPHRIILVGGKLFATESEKGWGLEGGMKYESPFKVERDLRRSSRYSRQPVDTSSSEFYFSDGTPKTLLTRRIEYLQKQPQYAGFSETQLQQVIREMSDFKSFPITLQG